MSKGLLTFTEPFWSSEKIDLPTFALDIKGRTFKNFFSTNYTIMQYEKLYKRSSQIYLYSTVNSRKEGDVQLIRNEPLKSCKLFTDISLERPKTSYVGARSIDAMHSEMFFLNVNGSKSGLSITLRVKMRFFKFLSSREG